MVVAPMMLATALAAVYLIWAPPSADLAAQTFRTELFEGEGFEVWTSAWYGGIHLPGYSLLFPPLAAFLGPRLVGALAAVAAAGLFGAIAGRRYGERARLGVMWFAAATSVNLFTGRLTFALGVALGLAALLALQRERPGWAVPLAVATALAAPLAALFLAIAAAALAIARRPTPSRGAAWRGAAAVAAAAVASIAALGWAFPSGGVEPFVLSSFQNVPIFAAVALVVVPRNERAIRWGVILYALVAIALFAFDNPVGGNAARLGALFAGPVLALMLAGRRPVVLAVLALPALAWQWSAPIRDVRDAVDDPSVEAAFHEPLQDELGARTTGRPVRIHVLPTRNRWEAVHVAKRYPLARGWLRQAESDDFELFQDGNLTPEAHLGWLREHAVSFVAVPHGPDLDYLAEDEAELIATGVPYLDRVWESEDWELYDVDGEPPLVAPVDEPLELAGDARLAALEDHAFNLTADEAGSYLVRIRWTRYWDVTGGDACVSRDGDWTRVRVRSPSVVAAEAGFSLDALVGAGSRCSE